MPIFNPHIVVFLIFGSCISASYLEMPLVRTPSKSQLFNFTSVKCSEPSNNTSDADYKQICFEKDITFSIPFIKDGLHYSLSADFTTPLSWIKGKDCKVENTHEKCHRLTETLVEKVKEKSRSKSKLHKMAEGEAEQNTIIEGSSETIRGEFEKQQSMSLIVKDSNRLNNFFQLIMLGLFIYGQKDNFTLIKTNFVNAMYISPNLNALSDGAISLRFDQTAENSFLEEIFTYVSAIEKTVTVSLGTETNNITIGDLTAKYTKEGYSGIKWIDMPSDEGFGKLIEVTSIGIGDQSEDREDDSEEIFPAALTLSASYISFPEGVIEKDIITMLKKQAVCKINKDNFVECSTTVKKKLESLIEKKLVIGLKGGNMIIPMNKLLLKVDHGKRAIFNIKKSYNHWAILGEPVFGQYVMFFDYVKNRIGFSDKREDTDEFMVEVVTLVRFLCCTMILGCCFICCFEPCRKLFKNINKMKREIKKKSIQNQQRRRRQPEEVPIEPRETSLTETIETTSESPGSLIDEF